MATIKKTIKKAQNGSTGCPKWGNCNKRRGLGEWIADQRDLIQQGVDRRAEKRESKKQESEERVGLYKPAPGRPDITIRSKKPTGENIGTPTDQAKSGKKVKAKMKTGGKIKKSAPKKAIKKTIKKK